MCARLLFTEASYRLPVTLDEFLTHLFLSEGLSPSSSRDDDTGFMTYAGHPSHASQKAFIGFMLISGISILGNAGISMVVFDDAFILLTWRATNNQEPGAFPEGEPKKKVSVN
jgi:hypothetical protein